MALRLKEKKFHWEADIADSLKYTTKSGRVVYGGGGITPDSIITVDSSLNYIKYNINFFKTLNFILTTFKIIYYMLK